MKAVLTLFLSIFLVISLTVDAGAEGMASKNRKFFRNAVIKTKKLSYKSKSHDDDSKDGNDDDDSSDDKNKDHKYNDDDSSDDQNSNDDHDDSSGHDNKYCKDCKIGIEKKGPATISPGSLITYTIKVTSQCKQSLRETYIVDPFPKDFVYMPAQSTSGCVLSGGLIECPKSTLAAYASVTTTLVFKVPASASCNSQIINQSDVRSKDAPGNWSKAMTKVECLTVQNTPVPTPKNPVCTATPTPKKTVCTPVSTPKNPTATPTATPKKTEATPVKDTDITPNPSPTPKSEETPAPTKTPIIPEEKPECSDGDITSTLISMDSGAQAQLQAINKALRQLKSFKAKDATYASKVGAQAAEIYRNAWMTTWSIPFQIRSCTNSTKCSKADFGETIRSYSSLSQELKNLSDQIASRLLKLKNNVKANTAANKLMIKAAALHESNLKSSANVPPFDVQC
jgi:hypothetical protein